MKTTNLLALATLFATVAFAQDRTIVTSTSTDISDNLDLTAVASIFGDAENLEDFERRLNDPRAQISNLDLNNDRQVDYLRVIESVEGHTHLIIVQSVLDRDVYQDVATIEVERDHNNQVQVQVVGDVYMYGNNYIYEPVYVSSPGIYNTFWVSNYRPYYSGWYWNYYPTYYYAWTPYPIFTYRNHIHQHINIHNHYNYVNIRRSDRAVALYSTRRSNGYERRYPTRSFAYRNANVSNRYELNQTRTIRNAEPRSNMVSNTRTESPRNIPKAGSTTPRTNLNAIAPRNNTQTSVPTNSHIKNQITTPRTNTAVAPRTNTNIKTQSTAPRTVTSSQNTIPRSNLNTQATAPRTTPNATFRNERHTPTSYIRMPAPNISQRTELPRESAPPRNTVTRSNSSSPNAARG